ncbi:MAG TPA: VWA domain-containing protein, partial [Steroidobacteraceae bacterium]|nr:VWA domain-containing protein [Steroidobacteraceae bacterium]
MIGDFHFLRPLWLLALLAAIALAWVVARREDVRSRWRGIIDPALLEHLVVDPKSRWRVRPIYMTVAAIIVGSIALAGPTWKRERPPFVEDKAPLAIAIDLSRTMDAIDVTPTRLERAKLKVHDLLERRAGARTALFAYAGSAHLVLPLTDDAALIRTYVDSLATGLMPVAGKDTGRALKVVEAALAREEVPGTILFMTDGVEAGAFQSFKAHTGKNQLMVLGIGTEEGGPVRAGAESFLTDSTGRRVFTRLDVEGLRKLKDAADVKVATMTLDDSDLDWIQRHVQTHLAQKQSDLATRWQDEGWWLTLPIGLLAALWFRRGWTIRWTSVVLIGCALSASPGAHAAGFIDAWLTPDQQGRLRFERGDYAAAAADFIDPMWKGVALYRAGQYSAAIDAFARLDTAESYYNQGNALAKLGKYPQAVKSYEEALQRRPDWPQAKGNLALVQALIPPPSKDEQQEEAPNLKP